MNWRIMGIGMVLSFALIALIAKGYIHVEKAQALPENRVGREAPAFKLPLLGYQAEGEFELKSVLGSPVVINFWSTTCIPCKDEHADLLSLADVYKPKGVVFLGVLHPTQQVEQEPARAKVYLKRNGAKYPTLIDPKKRTALDYGVTGIPETYVIDKSGMIQEKFVGSIKSKKSELAALLDSLL